MGPLHDFEFGQGVEIDNVIGAEIRPDVAAATIQCDCCRSAPLTGVLISPENTARCAASPTESRSPTPPLQTLLTDHYDVYCAPMATESFFSSLKKERIKKQIYKNRALAIADVADYIESFYNRTRRHSHLGGLSPEQFEAAHVPRRQRLH
jgi:transposase InsO family protein